MALALDRRLARVLARLGSFGHGVRAAYASSRRGAGIRRRHRAFPTTRAPRTRASTRRGRTRPAPSSPRRGTSRTRRRPSSKSGYLRPRRARSPRRHERRRRERWSRRLRRVVVRQSVRRCRRTPRAVVRPHRRPGAPGLSASAPTLSRHPGRGTDPTNNIGGTRTSTPSPAARSRSTCVQAWADRDELGPARTP